MLQGQVPIYAQLTLLNALFDFARKWSTQTKPAPIAML